MHCMLLVQLPRHAVELAHVSSPGHRAGGPATHEPVPLHVRVVSAELEQLVPHTVPEGACAQLPFPSHAPVLPHVPFDGHCPVGAGVPAVPGRP